MQGTRFINTTTSAIQWKTLDCHDYAQSETMCNYNYNYERRRQTINKDHLWHLEYDQSNSKHRCCWTILAANGKQITALTDTYLRKSSGRDKSGDPRILLSLLYAVFHVKTTRALAFRSDNVCTAHGRDSVFQLTIFIWNFLRDLKEIFLAWAHCT